MAKKKEVQSASHPDAAEFVRLRDRMTPEQRALWAERGYVMTVAEVREIIGEPAPAGDDDGNADEGTKGNEGEAPAE